MFGESIYTASRLERAGVFRDPTGKRDSAVKRQEGKEGEGKEGEEKEGEEKKEGEEEKEGEE